jgi:very-short-patch-repair endonuclease
MDLKESNPIITSSLLAEIKKALEGVFPITGKTELKCKCGKEISINGVTSHSTICPFAKESKLLFMKEALPQKCLICETSLLWSGDLKKDRWKRACAAVCSLRCVNLAKRILRGKNCLICNTFFYKTTKYCSRKCALEQKSRQAILWHKQSREKDFYQVRNQKIREASIGRNVGAIPWNKGLQGEEYLKHYLTANGSSNLYTSLRHNKAFFKTTEPEVRMKEILKSLNIKHKHNFFFIKHQYDFYIRLGEKRAIIECDGDFWHCSSRSNYYAPELAEQIRHKDSEKENFLKINFKKYPIVVLRFWEYSISKNKSDVLTFLQQLRDADTDAKFSSVVDSIQQYYKLNS